MQWSAKDSPLCGMSRHAGALATRRSSVAGEEASADKDKERRPAKQRLQAISRVPTLFALQIEEPLLSSELSGD